MAGGKYKPKRGGGKNFTQRSRAAVDEDAIGSWDMRDPAADRAKEDESSDDSDGFGGKKSKSDEESSEESSSDSEEEEGEEKTDRKVKFEPVIQTENPNRQQKVAVKASSLTQQKPQELSRRDREAAEKEAAKARYWALHQAGKTDEAKSDLARLRIIRQKREDAKLQREAEAAAKAQTAEEKLQGRRKG